MDLLSYVSGIYDLENQLVAWSIILLDDEYFNKQMNDCFRKFTRPWT